MLQYKCTKMYKCSDWAWQEFRVVSRIFNLIFWISCMSVSASLYASVHTITGGSQKRA